MSGTLLLWGEANTSFRFAGTILLHDGLTVTATLLVLGHLYLALVHPRTRPALRGMVRGSVGIDWARDHHSKWDVAADRAHTGVGRARRAPTVALLLTAAVVVALALAVIPRSTIQAPSAVPATMGDSGPVIVQRSKRPPLCVLTETCFGP
jgi:formate dehydrogenase subunit gamma